MPWRETEPMKERVRFIVELENGLYSMTELCKRYGISRKSGYKWAARYCWEGVEGLQDRSRAPKRCPQRTLEPLVEALLALRRKHPRWGPRKLLAYLKKRQPEKAWPARSTGGDILRRHGLVTPRRRRSRQAVVRAALVEPQDDLGHIGRRSVVLVGGRKRGGAFDVGGFTKVAQLQATLIDTGLIHTLKHMSTALDKGNGKLRVRVDTWDERIRKLTD